MPFWLLQTQVILWKKHLKGIQDSIANWGLQTRHITFILHDQCLSDDKHFKIGQSTPLASPHFLNKSSARPFSFFLTSVFPELVFYCFLPHSVTFPGAENESWHLSCEQLEEEEEWGQPSKPLQRGLYELVLLGTAGLCWIPFATAAHTCAGLRAMGLQKPLTQPKLWIVIRQGWVVVRF